MYIIVLLLLMRKVLRHQLLLQLKLQSQRNLHDVFLGLAVVKQTTGFYRKGWDMR